MLEAEAAKISVILKSEAAKLDQVNRAQVSVSEVEALFELFKSINSSVIDDGLINKDGVMQAHDEETRKFFKHSSVICVLSPRYASSKLSIFKQQVVGTFYTHHQKCVIVDTQAYENNRKIYAFIGGLDLCDGRYDTPEHCLFRDLHTVF